MFVASVASVLIFGAGFVSGQEYTKKKIVDSFATAFSNIGNNSSQSKSSTQSKTQVKFGESAKIKEFSISLAKVETKKEVKGEYTQLQIAKNEWLVITVSGENQGKKADSFYLGNTKLISNELEYQKSDTLYSLEQMNKNEVPKDFETCLSCSINPNVKAQSKIYFDVKTDLAKDKLVIENFEFDLK